MIGLYVHIPFCKHICSYCDFYKMIAKEEVITKYIEYLKKELELKKDYLKDIIGIYIGGGTPSSIGINNLKLLFTYLFTYININTIKVKHDKKFGQLPKNSYICRVIIKEMQTYENNYNGMCEP